MLENIHVKNIALIKEIDINFKKGLNIVTGETGAGKSLIIGSIAIGLGAKVSRDFIAENDEALIELTFTDVNKEVKELLNENNIDIDETLIIQRKIGKNKTINRINYTTVSLNFLKEAAQKLLQIHGQNDNHILLKKESHIAILDEFAKKEIAETINEYQEKYHKLVNISNEIKKLDEMAKEKLRDEDYLKFVVDEITQADIKLQEDEELKEKYNILVDAQNHSTGLNQVSSELDEVININLSNCINLLNNISNESSVKIVEMLYEANEILKECKYEIDTVLNNIDYSEEAFIELDERIDILDKLKKKYGGSLDAVLAYFKTATEKLQLMRDVDTRRIELQNEGIKLKEEVQDIVRTIHAIRVKAAKELEIQIKNNLHELNFIQAEFEIRFEKAKRLNINGQDEVEMFISTNVGYGLKPISNVASGGELARIMLAIESIVSNNSGVDTIIFDEVDSGISGKTGMMVAKRLREMSDSKQIICITHLPQLASAGDVNFKIDKNIRDNKTYTELEYLTLNGKIKEVARLLAGVDITDNAMNNAKELITQIMNKK